MKIPGLFIASTLAIATLSAVSVQADSTSTTYPGRCLATKDCATYGTGFDCIAVDSATEGLEKLNMCIAAGDTCSGSIAGSCPTFSSWPAKYRKVQTVCAFTVVTNCNKQFNVKTGTGSGSGTGSISVGDSSTTGSSNSTVECYTRNFTVNNEYKVVNGIYQCMDARKYISTNGGHLKNLTLTQIAACGGDATSSSPTLCNGQGTCSPTTAFAQEYACKCNKGYDGDKYCATVTSNSCSNLGQCGSSGTCVLTNSTTGTCSCKTGATGSQCATCDSTSKTACSSHGTCTSAGTCTCNSGYTGTLCADSTSTSSGGGSSTSAASSLRTQAATTVVGAITTIIALGVMVFA